VKASKLSFLHDSQRTPSYRRDYDSPMFGGTWADGTATILEKRVARAAGNDYGTKYKYVVDVEVPGTPPFRTTMGDPFFLNPQTFFAPRPGQQVRVKVDAKRHKVRFDKSDPGLDPRHGLRALLQDLEASKEQGRIPNAVYEMERKAILDGTAVIDGRRYGRMDIEAP
jgi:hypothetical protein